MRRSGSFVALAGIVGASLCLALVGCEGGSPQPAGDGTADEVIEESEGLDPEVQGDEDPAGTEADAPTDEVAIAANVSPTDIDPGYVPESDVTTSDLWWPNGVRSGEGVYFVDAANEAGTVVAFYSLGDSHGDEIWDVTLTDDGHLTSAEGASRAFDIVFVDNFTCYDHATDTLYRRGEMTQAEYEESLLGTYALNPNDPSEDTFSLMEGGILVQTYKGTDHEGTWAPINTTEVRFDFGTYDDKYEFVIQDGVVTAIMDGSVEFSRI